MSTWDSMSPADYAACVDAGRGEPRDVRDEADQALKEAREGGDTWNADLKDWDNVEDGLVPVFSGAGPCILCGRLTVGTVHGDPLCAECERRMAKEQRED